MKNPKVWQRLEATCTVTEKIILITSKGLAEEAQKLKSLAL